MANAFPLWPRQRSSAVALAVLLALQLILFLAATRHSFFVQDDYVHFALAEERPFLRYLATPIIHTYPAPGHRLLFYLFHSVSPLNYLAARTLLLVLLGVTTILLGQLVRTLARSDAWWTVALLTPFALSLTLLSPVNWWSNGVPVIPALLFTVLALVSWVRSYTDRHRLFWLAVTVFSIGAAGAFYMKFLLIPLYLLLLRVAIFPRLLPVSGGIWHLWEERVRWIAVAAPPALFMTVYVLSGLAARSYVPGDRPYLDYLATAWFRAFVPVAVLNTPLAASPPSAWTWLIVISSQVLFWGAVGATWRRTALAARAWLVFAAVFLTNMLMVGAVRLPGFGVEIAYSLRYYPEVVLFVPVVLAIGLRQGAERADVPWDRSRPALIALALLASAQVAAFAYWAPRTVGQSEGVLTKKWFDHFRRDVEAARKDGGLLRIVDSTVPEYVASRWMAPRNRISTMLQLLHVDAAYNELSDSTYVVLADGSLGRVMFRPVWQIPTAEAVPDGLQHAVDHRPGRQGACIRNGESVVYRPESDIVGERLALRATYAGRSRHAAKLAVDTGDPDQTSPDLELRPFRDTPELVDLGTSRLRALTVAASPGDLVCIEQMEIGVLGPSRPVLVERTRSRR